MCFLLFVVLIEISNWKFWRTSSNGTHHCWFLLTAEHTKRPFNLQHTVRFCEILVSNVKVWQNEKASFENTADMMYISAERLSGWPAAVSHRPRLFSDGARALQLPALLTVLWTNPAAGDSAGTCGNTPPHQLGLHSWPAYFIGCLRRFLCFICCSKAVLAAQETIFISSSQLIDSWLCCSLTWFLHFLFFVKRQWIFFLENDQLQEVGMYNI